MNQEEDFPILLERHKRILFKICNSYCRNPADREDLAQEIVVQLWRSFPSFDATRSQFSTWMYRVALNVAMSFYRRESARTRRELSPTDLLLTATGEATHSSPEIDALYGFIGSLDPLTKALVLLYLDGNTYLEIANILGITETNVATKISRLKQTMRKELTEKYNVRSR